MMKPAEAIATRSLRNRRQKSWRGDRAVDLLAGELDDVDVAFWLDEEL